MVRTLSIDGEHVEWVSQYKYLGIIVDDELKGNASTYLVMKNATKGFIFSEF